MEGRKIAELKHNKEVLGKNESIFTWGWNGAAGRRRLERRVNLINDFIALHGAEAGAAKKVRILEVGCGTGLLTEHLVNFPGSRIFSFDIYDAFVKKARERTQDIDKDLFFLVSDAEHLPFLNEIFDIIVGISVLHHLNLSSAQMEIGRVLKPGGKFIFSEPNMLNPQIFIQKNVGFIKKHMGDSPNETAFYPNRLKKSFARHGLKVEVYPFDFLHPKTPSSLIPIVEKIGLFIEKRVFLKYIAGSLLIYGEKT